MHFTFLNQSWSRETHSLQLLVTEQALCSLAVGTAHRLVLALARALYSLKFNKSL